MKLSPDDPRLTAYALGELDAAERAEIERALEDSPECRAIVEEIRATAQTLEAQFASELTAAGREPQETLTTQIMLHMQHDLGTRASAPERIIPFPRRMVFWGIGMAAAIAALLTLTAIWMAPEPNLTLADKSPVSAAGEPAPVLPVSREETNRSAPATPAEPESDARYGLPAQTAPNPQPSTLNLQPGFAESTVQQPAIPPVSPVRKPEPAPARRAGTIDQSQSPAPEPYLAETETAAPSLAFRTRYAPPAEEPPAGRSPATAFAPSFDRPRVEVRRSPQFDGTAAERFSDGDFKKRDSQIWPGQHRETAEYPHYSENQFLSPLDHPLSTFSIDVDTASYANIRRFLNQNRLPPRDAVRIEEMINYFSYDYPQPRGNEPFSATLEAAGCPWNPQHRLVRVALKGREIARAERPPSNFVFLIDVSGSMSPRNRLPLIKQALQMLVKRMNDTDRVGIVVYASQSGVVLESTSCEQKERILAAIDSLEAGGSTNGGEGIQQAYRLATRNFIEGGVNRVILCTDGDFNVGITDRSALVDLIQEKARSGVFLSALGVGTDNYKDALMQKLANQGNGNYAYIDTLEEAQKVLIEQMNGTLVTIAKDVKIQIEFNPSKVGAYRLIGYEKRVLNKEDFNDDKKDAGEIGAGHTVTALYEIVPAGVAPAGGVDGLKYQRAQPQPERIIVPNDSQELLTLKLRYKKPDSDTSTLREIALTDEGRSFAQASRDFQFAAGVAGFGMILRGSEHKGSASYDTVLEIAGSAKGADREGYRAEFINLVKKARSLQSGR